MEKKIDGNKIIEAVRVPDVTTAIEYHGVTLNVRERISFPEMLSFVNTVADSCFTLEGEYAPQVDMFAFKSNVIDFFTDVELPEDLAERYKLVMMTDLYSVVTENVYEAQLDDMRDSVSKLVEYKLATNVSAANHELSAVAGTLKTIAETYGQFAQSLDSGAVKQMMDALNANTADRNRLLAAYKVVAEDAANKYASGGETKG